MQIPKQLFNKARKYLRERVEDLRNDPNEQSIPIDLSMGYYQWSFDKQRMPKGSLEYFFKYMEQ